MDKHIVAIVGTYRKGHITDSIVDEMLDELKSRGAKIKKIYLMDRKIEFCTNCRACNQMSGVKRGACVLKDDMSTILDDIDSASGLIIASPVNFYNVTAVTRRFMERLVCYAYWPWGMRGAPKLRDQKKEKKAVVVACSAAPGLLIPLFTGAPRALKAIADVVGARVKGSIYSGFSGMYEKQNLSSCVSKKARKLASKLL